MSTNFRISEAASLGLHAMAFLAAHPRQRLAVKDIAAALCVSVHHLAKVLQRLARTGLVVGSRGPTGGFLLGRDPREISLLEIVETVEGPLETEGCLLKSPARCDSGICILGQLNAAIRQQVKSLFAHTQLAALGAVFGGLQ
jgi:Rrf2 family protein